MKLASDLKETGVQPKSDLHFAMSEIFSVAKDVASATRPANRSRALHQLKR